MYVTLNRDSGWWIIPLVIILLLAFATRVAWLDRHPLWWDEGLNVYFAHQSPAALLEETRITHDANPLVYRLAMGRWKGLIGSSAFSLRLFSVFLGTSAVALTWALGCWLTSKQTALLATLFVALSPVQVHYSRESKGYAFALVCALLSTYAWGRKLGYFSLGPTARSRAAAWWAVYVLSTTAALGAHYYLGLLILWQGLWVVSNAGLALARRSAPRREILVRLGLWVLAMGVVALLLTPWLLAVLDTTVEMVTGVSVDESLSVWGYLGQVGRVFGAGPGEEGALALIAAGGLAVLSVIGLLGARVSGRRVFLFTWVAVPLAAAYWIQAAYSFFSPRFLQGLNRFKMIQTDLSCFFAYIPL
ncbi:MAG: glycosyltransferase family 39 protein, partial [Chloroflexi bacterium]|nr:glycosyltransferase family 39 protein [Chloroflexota bacterium]